MANLAEVKELRKQALASFYDEYKELIATWRDLDTKAQGNVTIAGIFIAGAFGYISKVNGQHALYEKLLFGLTILLLIASVILAIRALKIKTIFSPPLGSFMSKYVNDIGFIEDNEFNDYTRGIFVYHGSTWEGVNLELRLKNDDKGKHLRRAQTSLLAAVLLAALLTFLKTFL